MSYIKYGFTCKEDKHGFYRPSAKGPTQLQRIVLPSAVNMTRGILSAYLLQIS